MSRAISEARPRPGTITSRREYIALNGIRGIAAIAVMLYHGGDLIGHVVPRGHLAVDLFFALSGFVIAHAYADRLAAGLSIRSFIEIRVIRFWPLYALGLALGLLSELLLIVTGNGFGMSPGRLALATLAATFFLPFPLASRNYLLFPMNIPSWSLFFELLVNILYAVARPVLSTRTLAVIIPICTVILFAFCIPAAGFTEVGVRSTTMAGGLLRTVLSFSLGLIVYRIKPALPSLPVPLLFLLVALLLWFPWGGEAYEILFVLVLSPLLLAFGAASEPHRRVRSFAVTLGLISFPLYAIHRPILYMVAAVSKRMVHVPPALFGWTAIFGILILAYFAVPADEVARRWISARLRPPLRKDPAQSAAP